jgi:hypothetical protein
MLLRLALSLLLAACSKESAPDAGPALGRGDAVVLPNGSAYRVLQVGPVLRGNGSSIGGGITYWSKTADLIQVSRDAQQLVAAFGPELELTGEKLLNVQAKIAGGPEGQTNTVSRAYRLERGRWLPPDALPAAPIAPAPIDDPALAVRAGLLSEASESAGKWLGNLDRDPVKGVVSRMNEEFRTQIKAAPDRWLQITRQRSRLNLAEGRTELYRMEMPSKMISRSPWDTVVVLYQAGTPRQRVLERVIMIKEPEAWRVGGYAYEPLPPL